MTTIDKSTGEIIAEQISEAVNERGRFEASKYLRKLAGRDYLEVKWRLVWLRHDHPEAIIQTELVKLEGDFALFKARVVIPGFGEATGWGSETKGDFFDFIEKAETKALGRALAALGYGTQFCDDFDFAAGAPEGRDRVVDSPVERPSSNGASSGALCTPAQLKLIYLTASRDLHITEEELEERCQAQYSRLPLHLTKREASEFIDSLKGGGGTTPNPKGPTQPTAAEPTATMGDTPLDWAARWVPEVMGRDVKAIAAKERPKAIEAMGAHLRGAGIKSETFRPLCAALQSLASPERDVSEETIWSELDSHLVEALTRADQAELFMLKRLAGEASQA